MTISGIGPKLAVTILSGGSVEDLVTAIKRGDLDALRQYREWKEDRRADRRRAQRQAQDFAAGPAKTGVEVDVISALENLGYHRACRKRNRARWTAIATQNSMGCSNDPCRF